MYNALFALLPSYLLGSVSFSILVTRWLRKVDIRQYGSGNAGATNTLRVLGIGPALAVFGLDLMKGCAAVALGLLVDRDSDWLPVACGLAAIGGHNWPVYFRFKGGKGIATTAGVMVVLAFWPTLIAGATAIAVIAWLRYVSLGSLLFAVLLPVLVYLFGGGAPLVWGATAVLALAVARHRKNIVKLWNGTENKLGRSEKGQSHGV